MRAKKRRLPVDFGSRSEAGPKRATEQGSGSLGSNPFDENAVRSLG